MTNDFKRYIKWSKILKDNELSARKNNPKSFYKFTSEQINSSPFGRIIIPEKYKLNSSMGILEAKKTAKLVFRK